MDFLELAKDRYSVRNYSSRPVEQEKIDCILKAAQFAPTAVNYQPQMIYVLKSNEALDRINRVCRCIYGAPLVCFSYTFIEEWHWANQTRQNCLYQGLGIEYSASQML